MSKKILTREEILGKNDLVIKKVSVPEWGGDVYIKSLNGTERDQWELHNANNNEVVGIRARLLAISCCNEAGELLFEAADFEALTKKNGVPLTRIFNEIMKMNYLNEADIEELEKN